MGELQGLIFDVQSFSVHDGPGSRTLVFLAGCPLRCEWCANPEGMELKQKILYSKQKCKNKKTGCTRCVNACPHHAIKVSDNEGTPLIFNRDICRKCQTFECSQACYHEAARVSGKWMTVSELLKIIERDRIYWSSAGGVTFTGGEPLLQKDFLTAVLQRCKALSIHTVIETTAYDDTALFLKTMQLIDFAFIDLKQMDSLKHQELTGVSNNIIFENIKALVDSKWPGRLILRMPVIRNFNDTNENIISIINFMKKLDLYEINILPFHRMGDSKWTQLGLEYKYSNELPTPYKKLTEIQDLFLEHKIACYVGEEVYY